MSLPEIPDQLLSPQMIIDKTNKNVSIIYNSVNNILDEMFMGVWVGFMQSEFLVVNLK